ncbi:MAG TPA: DUF6036 family nucleotidyltransferase [Pirellulales bacterium]|nr:DUF6036 family nucleotidyltransferase [Pirellulales bacterium]
MDEILQTTLADAIRFLEAQQIRYALIGGLAASLLGEPRVTADVDLVIAADVDHALRLVKALQGSKFRPLFDQVEEVVQKAFILPLKHRLTTVKVDLVLGLSGFEQQVIARAKPTEIAGLTVSVATAEDLLIMKVLAGRPQDEQDLHGLVIAQRENLDWKYCLKLAADLAESIGQDLIGRVKALRDGHHRK